MITIFPTRAARRVKTALDSVPTDFDATTLPILDAEDSESLAFGVSPLCPIGAAVAEVVADLRFRRQVERLHRFGARAVAELLAEIGAERNITTIVDQKLATYAELNVGTVELAGGDGYWPAPLREVDP